MKLDNQFPTSVQDLAKEVSELRPTDGELGAIWSTIDRLGAGQKGLVTVDAMESAGIPKKVQLETATLLLLSRMPDLSGLQLAHNIQGVFDKLTEQPATRGAVDEIFDQILGKGQPFSLDPVPDGWKPDGIDLSCHPLRPRRGADMGADAIQVVGTDQRMLGREREQCRFEIVEREGRWFLESQGRRPMGGPEPIPLSDLRCDFLEALLASLKEIAPEEGDAFVRLTRQEKPETNPPEWAAQLIEDTKEMIDAKKASAAERHREVARALAGLRYVGRPAAEGRD